MNILFNNGRDGGLIHLSHCMSCKKRGVSEIIATLMLMSISLIGTVLVLSFFQNADIANIVGSSEVESSLKSIQLVGYDTRDSLGLSGISSLSNILDAKGLCTTSCSSNPDLIPINSGTEFVVLDLRNNGGESIFLSSLVINDIKHTFDSATSGAVLDASVNAATCTLSCPYPKAGKFSIVPISDNTQKSTNEIVVGQEVRLVIKLSSDISSDIKLTKPLVVQIDTNRLDQEVFIVPTGGAS
ncbi:hypothetical protein [Nitrosopumilus piranensis]|uniref:hypothetical protein n=1 Tax=Nitrosopumilus piranensis TaxID=1582439 RepID=UPI0011E5D2BC|nr:hypothetical protein [Nitrosopumilus piranensis]